MRRVTVPRLALAAVAAAVGAYWGAGTWYSRPARRNAPSEAVSGRFESILLPSFSGSDLSGWLLKGRTGKGAVVLMHGYRGSRLTMLKHALVLNMQGFTVLSFDFQAHGRSGGKRVTLGWLERRDAEAAMLYMRTMYPAEKLGIVAVSMGGAAAVVGQAKKIASAMVLEQVYPRLDRAVLNRFGPVLGHAFLVQVPLRLGFRPSSLAPIDCIKDYAKPLLLLAGSADTGTPPSETQALFAAANAPKELVVFDGAGHECLLEKDPALWLSKVLPFLEEHLGQSVT